MDMSDEILCGKKILNVAVYLLFIGQRVLVDNYRGGVYFKLPKIIHKSGLTDRPTDTPTNLPIDQLTNTVTCEEAQL